MLNIAANLERSAQLHPDKTAIYFADQQFSYSQLNTMANRVANGLTHIGIEPGDKVALSCPNLPYFPVVYYGILKAGAAVVPLNVLFKPDEIAYHLADSEAKTYLCFEGTDELPMAQMGLAGFQRVESCQRFIVITADPAAAGPVEDAQTLGMLISEQADDADIALTNPDDTAVILYTSGTTGRPKGAELTHSNMAMNAMASHILIQLTGSDTQLITLPLFHSFAQTVQMNASIEAGSAMVLIARFSPDAVLHSMQQQGVTVFAGVPTMFIALLNHPKADQYDLKAIAQKLRVAVSGGASLPVEVLKQFEQKFDVPILEGYGLSETSPVATFNLLEYPRIPGSVGQPIVGVSVKIVDGEGAELPCGESGEVVIKGHNVMKGYYNRPDASTEAIKNGWFHSGDIGRMDERGNFYIVDRLKEMILRGGFNVYPREIEEVLMSHDAVIMVAVVGVPHDTHGEEIKAYVVAKDGFNDADALQAYARERLADYKYPRQIVFRDQLPMTATGKILKKNLKAELS